MSRRLHRGYLTAASLPRYRSLRSTVSNMASSTTGCPLKYVFFACAYSASSSSTVAASSGGRRMHEGPSMLGTSHMPISAMSYFSPSHVSE